MPKPKKTKEERVVIPKKRGRPTLASQGKTRAKQKKRTIVPLIAKSPRHKNNGRPTKYKPEYDEMAHGLALLGLTIPDIAAYFGVNPDTIHEWKKVHPSFSDSLEKGGIQSDIAVVNAFRKRAMGFEHTTHETVVDKDGEVRDIVKKQYFPPDTAAGFIWLKNRRHKQWRDKQEVEHSGSVSLTEAQKELSDIFNAPTDSAPEK